MSRPLDSFQFRKGKLAAEGVSLLDVADATGTPVYVYSAEGFLSPLRKLQRGLRGLDPLICFAVKANSNLAILKLLADAGAGMDIVSGGELFRAQAAGVPGKNIVFSGVGKTPGEIIAALNAGVFSFNVESRPELEMINAVAAELAVRASVALRFNPDVDAKTHPYISTGLKKNKFGLNRSEVLAVVADVRGDPAHYRGIAIRGLGIHIGSQLLSLAPLAEAFTRVRSLMDELERGYALRLAYLDLGGGVGIAYGSERSPAISAYCALIQKHFGGKRKCAELKLLLEPGRLLAGNAGVLLTTLMYRKNRQAKDFLIVDAAMNDLARPSLYGSHHEIIPTEERLHRGARSKVDIVGPVCETSDCFGTDRKLSPRLQRGDLLAILSAGAYGFSMASNYNSRPRPPEVLIQDGRFQVIRERETYADLVRGESSVFLKPKKRK